MLRFTIIGAGPVGTLMALMLARRGHRARLLERRPDPRHSSPERGRSINLALAARGIRALEHADLMQRVLPLLISMPGRMLHTETGALQFLPYGRNEQEVIYAIDRNLLNCALLEAAAVTPGIELQFNTRCIDIDPAASSVELRNDLDGAVRREPFEILLAADGAGSGVRTALGNRRLMHSLEEPLAHDYKELHLAPAGDGTFAFEPHALHIWPRGEFMLIALPNTDHSFTATLFLPRHGTHSFDALTDAGSVEAFFETHFADALAVMPNLAQQFAHHPQSRLATLHCQRWHLAGQVLLLGDAAHAIVPFHGQGLNCGFEDCLVLDRLLSGQSDCAQVFARFEQERQPDTDAIARMALENYLEMRAQVRTANFIPRQRLAAELERQFPGRFIPRYSMVMFHPEIRYAEALRRGQKQEQVLDRLEARNQRVPLDTAATDSVRLLLEQVGL